MVRKARETAPQEDIVTEAIENTEAQTEATEDEAPATNHTFNIGDEATVIRGKLRGRKGAILAYNEGDKTYAITLDGGTLAVVNAGNLKPPVDSTVSVRAIVAALAGFGQEAGSADRDAVVRLAAMLDEVAPGTSAKLTEAFSA
jgi:hypothetical protein